MRSDTHHPPLILLLVTFGAGLATGLARFPDPRLVIPALAVAAFLLHRRPVAGLLSGSCLLGALSGGVAWRGEQGSCAASLRRGEVTVTLVPLDPPPVEHGRVEAEVVGCRGAVAVRWGAAADRVAVGRPVLVQGKWYPRPDGLFARPGGTLIATSATPHPSLSLGTGLAPRIPRWRSGQASHAVRARLLATTHALYGDRAPLVDALLFDRRGAIDRDTRDRFAASGLVHLLSISGFHVGLIVGWVLVLLRAGGMGRERAWIIATVVGVGYVAWLGWPAPATRAAALAVLLCQARVRQRVVRWEALLAATAFVVLLVDPWALADLGGWLSVASLWGATVAVEWSDRRFGTGAFARTLSGSVGATMATAPLTAGAIGSVAVAGVALNFVGIPVAAVAVPAVLLSVLVAPLWRGAAEALAAGGGGLLALLDRIAALGAAIPYGHFTLPTGWMSALPWTAALGVGWWCISGEATRMVAFTRGAAATGVLLWIGLGGTLRRIVVPARAGLTMTFLDVGQGDATAIRTPHGVWLVIDAGPAGEGRDAGRSVVAPFLAAHGARSIEALLLSHAHLDHYGGIPALLDRFEVRRLLEPGAASDDPGYRSLLDLVAASGAEWHPLRRGDSLVVDGVAFLVLHPDADWAEWGLDLNEDSAVLLVRYGAFEALLAGDAGLPAEAALRGAVGDVEVLKVGHHGSAGASSSAWLAELQPEAAIVSVGRGNRYHHPSAEALGRLGASGAEVWRTDELGDVEVWTDGGTFTVAARDRRSTLPAGPSGP